MKSLTMILVLGLAATGWARDRITEHVEYRSTVPFEYIRIGDTDGFGWGDGLGLTAANGGPCNLDGIGVLTAADLLPDLNGNGSVATGSGDDWDNSSWRLKTT